MALVFEQLLTEELGDAAYLIGDDSRRVAAVIDPQVDVKRYVDALRAHGLALKYVIQTHVHEDFLSGALALTNAVPGATLCLSGHDAPDYGFEHRLVRDGERLELGSVSLTVRHTPGHTPEHIAILAAQTDGTPFAVFSGGSLLVGAAGRTDLLGPERLDELTAKQYRTLHHFFLGLDDGVAVYPTHVHGSPVTSPGAKESAETKILETGAAVLQNKPPIEAINAYLDGFHFYNGNMKVQMEAHHYCSILNDDLIQCVIYDGNVKDAKIMGVEYIISAKLFANLPDTEKAMWHSHVQEVKSGQLIAPGIPQVAEHALMEKLIHTYGKTWHTWHTDLHKDLPIGVPQLMMGFTADGQADAAMVAERDKRFGIDSAEKRKDRESIAAPAIDPGADGWQHGKMIQLQDPTGSQRAAEHATQSAATPSASSSNARSNKP